MIEQVNPGAAYRQHKQAIDAAVGRVLDSGWYILGPEVSAFESEFAAAMGSEFAVAVASGTDALELALRACCIGPGDRVATVAHTAVATVAAIVRSGALPVFVDIDPQTYTMDPAHLQQVIDSQPTGGIKAVVPVHLYGLPADMPAICEVAQCFDLVVIEDCAQAHGAAVADRKVGTLGDFGCFSFYPTKNLAAFGDAGALLCHRESQYDQLRSLRQYGWVRRSISENPRAVNSRLDEIQAAILRVKLPYLEMENQQRQSLAERYTRLLQNSESIRCPQWVAGRQHVFHQYVIRVHERERLMHELQRQGIATAIHYPLPVHRQPAYCAADYTPLDLPVTERVCGQILSLPMYPQLTLAAVETTATALCSLVENQ